MTDKYWQDQKTGLFWELKTFSNRRMEYTISEAIEYANELNFEKYAGFDDWRLPNIEELSSLCVVQPYKYNGDYISWRAWFENNKNAANNGFFIVKELSENTGKDGWYWSATPKENGEYYLINFRDGNTNFHLANQSFYVRCVRG